MQRLAIACSVLFFCGSISMANNFTPIKSSLPTKLTLKQKLAEELNVGAWVRARPQFALWFHYANRLVISALGPAINELA
jgi:hypothetical protein